MILNDQLWSQHQYQMLVSFVHHLAYHRVLKKYYDVAKQESEFWTRTIDAHLLKAIADWCIVFGTDSSELHWKNVITEKKSE